MCPATPCEGPNRRCSRASRRARSVPSASRPGRSSSSGRSTRPPTRRRHEARSIVGRALSVEGRRRRDAAGGKPAGTGEASRAPGDRVQRRSRRPTRRPRASSEPAGREDRAAADPRAAPAAAGAAGIGAAARWTRTTGTSASAAQTWSVRIVHGPSDRIRPLATHAKPPTSAAATSSVRSAPSARRPHRRAPDRRDRCCGAP